MGKSKLFEGCHSWLTTLKDSLPGMIIQKNNVRFRITATNVPATADISYTIMITVREKGYDIALKDYIYHSINGRRLPVEKAVTVNDYKNPVNIERVLIMHKYPAVFKTLSNYLQKNR